MKTTIDHDEIRSWIELHNGRPGIIAGTSSDESIGELCIMFGIDTTGGNPISWQEFFDRFDTRNIALRYDNHSPKGDREPAYAFIDRDKQESYLETDADLPEDIEGVDENMFPSAE